MKVLFWIGDIKDPSPRFRFLQFVEEIRKQGVTLDIVLSNPSRNRKVKFEKGIANKLEVGFFLFKRLWQVAKVALFKAKKYDIIYTNKDILPNQGIYWAEKWLAAANPNLIFDIDDAIYLGQRGHKLHAIWPYYKALIAGSPVHIEYIQPKHPHLHCYYVPMAIDTQRYQPIGQQRKPGKIRIGWSGSHFTNIYALPVMKTCMEMLAQQLDFELIVISNVDPNIQWEGVQSRFVLWTEADEVNGLQQIDIGLMPLKDEPFERGKCALKAVQYMAVGIPALVSPVGVNTLIVEDGINGFHCASNEAFVERIVQLANNEKLRLQMGEAARQKVVSQYSVEVLAKRYIQIFEEVKQAK